MDKAKPRILIVEDDLSSQQYYTIILENSFDLEIVSTVVEAKKALAKTEFSVAIIDISLPGGENGIDLMRFMREKYPQKPTCIALTAHAFPQNRIEAMEAGAAEFFTKPIMSGVLIASLEKHIEALGDK
ncbi:MAG: response regulator [Candidatus Marinimicrobia bacterium]|nr:response regulator [FCB group bacterium]MBL7024888.1 response regulator [Candidatus Neomarinimicrobiota bacterium]